MSHIRDESVGTGHDRYRFLFLRIGIICLDDVLVSYHIRGDPEGYRKRVSDPGRYFVVPSTVLTFGG